MYGYKEYSKEAQQEYLKLPKKVFDSLAKEYGVAVLKPPIEQILNYVEIVIPNTPKKKGVRWVIMYHEFQNKLMKVCLEKVIHGVKGSTNICTFKSDIHGTGLPIYTTEVFAGLHNNLEYAEKNLGANWIQYKATSLFLMEAAKVLKEFEKQKVH